VRLQNVETRRQKHYAAGDYQSMRHLLRFLPAALLIIAGVADAQWTWTPQTGRFVNIKRMPKETAELQIEYARSLLLNGDYRKAFRETDKFIQFYGNDPLSDENLFIRGEIQMAQGRWMEGAKTFQQLIAAYPNTSRYEESIAKQYEIGDRYYQRGELKSKKWMPLFRKRPYKRAAEVYTMVVDNQPFTPQAAEAQYKIGLCHYANKEYLDAAFEYRRVVEDYSASDWIDEASHGLAMCYYRASLPSPYDQTPSELTVTAIDDFATRFPQDDRLGELQEKRREMRESIASQRLETARIYERRREYPAAKMYYELLTRDFSDTQAAEAATTWLNENAGVLHVGDKYKEGIRSSL
jgi:outer membrane protein assembly factor BamD